MAQIKQTTFSRIGNLTFYDGWSPDYIYFKSLYNADEYYIINNGPGSWDPRQAQPVAQQAINDALSHQFIKNNSLEDSNKYFEDQFVNKIIPFLEQAYAYERKNERAWIYTKIRQLRLTFKEHTDDIPAIKKILEMIKSAENGIDYNEMITLINIVLQGIKNTKTIAKYEEGRIKEINATITRLIHSRKKQTVGLLYSQHKDLEEQAVGAKKSANKLWTKISTEYTKTGQLARKHKVTVRDKSGKYIKKTKYVLFGGQQFSKIKPTIDNVITEWAEATIKDLLQKPEVLSNIVNEISISIALTAKEKQNIKLLEPKIRKIIALAILQYSMNNLSTLLDKKIDEIAISEVEQDLMKNQQIFDTATNLNFTIIDLNEDSLGYKIAEPKLLEETKNFAELHDKTAEKLYFFTDAAIQFMTEKQQEESTLFKILNNRAYTEGRNADKTKKIFELIHSIEALYPELDKLTNEYKKKKENIVKEIYLPQNSNTAITISITNGNIQIEQGGLIKAIQETEAYKYMQFKQFSPTTLRQTIAALKRNASINLKNDIINSIKADVYKIDPNQLVSELKQELQKIDVRMKGFTIAEVLSTMQFKTSGSKIVAHMGPKNTKNDILTIEFQYDDLVQQLHSKIHNSNILREKYKKTEELYTKAQEEFYTKLYEEMSTTITKLQSNSSGTKYSDMITTILKSSDTWDEKVQEILNKLDKVGEDYVELLNKEIAPANREAESKRYEQFLEDLLNNSFITSTTVKSYNTYSNQIGFHGGSLGGTLDAQLTTIADIFKTARIPIEQTDLDWMKFSILNCFEGSVLKTSNKNIIENYLGALMAFAIFDEGGAESSIISNFYKTYFEAMHKIQSPKILHLYRVNGIYVPGSVVIKRTLDTLKQQVLPAIYTKIPNTIKRGAGITIINTVNESLIPNRPLAENLNTPNSTPWATVGMEAGKNHVKLQILFLAGLLDIVNGINKTLEQVNIPT